MELMAREGVHTSLYSRARASDHRPLDAHNTLSYTWSKYSLVKSDLESSHSDLTSQQYSLSQHSRGGGWVLVFNVNTVVFHFFC